MAVFRLPGLLASLWEFPSVQLTDTESSDPAVDAALHLLLPELLPPPPADGTLQPLGDITHVFSHIRRVYRARAAEVPQETEEPPPVPDGYRAARWVTREELLQAGIPTPVRKVTGPVTCRNTDMPLLRSSYVCWYVRQCGIFESCFCYLFSCSFY